MTPHALNVAKTVSVLVVFAALAVSAVIIAVIVAVQPVTHTYTYQGVEYRLAACDVDRLGQTVDDDCFRIAGVTDNGPGHDYIMIDGTRTYAATRLD